MAERQYDNIELLIHHGVSLKAETKMLEDLQETSMLLPTSNWQVYASQERLVIASEGWFVHTEEDSEGTSMALQETYLVTYQLQGLTAIARSLGTVPGYVLNQFSIDHYYSQESSMDYLRLATSTRDEWARDNRRNLWTRT
jgi:hypothetical protein